MAVSHPSTTLRTALADAVDAAIGTSGLLRFYTSTSYTTTICTINLSTTAFGAAVSGVITLDLGGTGYLEGTCGAAGTITAAQFLTSGGTPIVACSVSATGGGGDIILTNNAVSSGDILRITGLTYTAPT